MHDKDQTKEQLNGENQKNEDKLRETELLYRTLLKQFPDGILIIDAQGNFLEFNEAAHRQLGYSREEFERLRISDVNPFQSPEEVQASMKKVLDNESAEFDVKHRTKGGEIRHVHVIAHAMTLSNRTVFHTIWRDITERKRAEASRQESEEQYRALFEGSPDAILFADPETGIILDANTAASQLLALPQEKIIGIHQSNIHPPQKEKYYREIFAQHVEDARGRKGLHPSEIAVIRPDGSEVPVEVLTQMVTIKGKKILLGVFRDITEHKRAEQKLDESIDRFRRLSEAGFEGIIISEQGVIVDANTRMAQILGCKFSDLIGNKVSDFVAPESLTSFENHIRSGSEERYECFAKRKYGSTFPVEIQGRSLPYEGRMLRITAIRDITGRKWAEEALRNEKAFSDAIIDSLPGVFYICDEEGRLLRGNDNEKALTGYSTEELSRMNVLQLFREDRELAASKMREVFEFGRASVEASIVTKSGMTIPFLFSGFRMIVDNKRYLVGVGIDVSERKRLEAQLRHAQKMEAIGVLAGGIAHDFNNILSAIIGYVSLMKMKMKPDDQLQHNADQILASAERAAKLTHDLLSFSRKQVVNLSPLNINDIICGIQNMLARLIRENIEFKVRCAPEQLIAEVDKGQIEQVLMNLATNARDAMPQGGTLEITTGIVDVDDSNMEIPHDHKSSRYILITVTDSGIGMDKETQEHLFEPFFTTKEVGKGTGLGLAITYGIIKKHHGFIYVYSEPGEGATFKIYLPLVKAAAKEVRRKEHGQPSSGHETILLVEDESAVRQVTKDTLEEFGYTVIEAIDGDDGVRVFRENQHRIQLILCDLIMPHKNGKEVYDEVKKIRPDIKVIFMSGYTADIIEQQGILEKGMNFVDKPTATSVLLEKIRAVLGR
ncbi:MAG TPA: PAS domain S-box protein [Nitrospirota bacterium]|nr:PAS domain S-box protein [Nitrospirota bacterium]